MLDQRSLNRALLARQGLLERRSASAFETIEHLVCLQGQAPLAPYVGLWTRLAGFEAGELAELLTSRQVVRATLLRGTVHLATATDCLAIRPLMEPVVRRGFLGGFSRTVQGIDVDAVVEYGSRLLADAPYTRVGLRGVLAERWPDWDVDTMAYAVSYLVPTVQVTPRGVWGSTGSAALTTIESWLGSPLGSGGPVDAIVLRYLAAFGPASVMDVQAWSGLTRLREVIDRLRPSLAVFTSDDGVELYDVADAPRPDPHTPVPPRFLPEYDNVLFGHADRSRVIPDGRPVPLPPGNGAVLGTLLVDGVFAGTWRITRGPGGAALAVRTFAALSAADHTAVADEGERLLAFAAADAAGHDVQVTTV